MDTAHPIRSRMAADGCKVPSFSGTIPIWLDVESSSGVSSYIPTSASTNEASQTFLDLETSSLTSPAPSNSGNDTNPNAQSFLRISRGTSIATFINNDTLIDGTATATSNYSTSNSAPSVESDLQELPRRRPRHHHQLHRQLLTRLMETSRLSEASSAYQYSDQAASEDGSHFDAWPLRMEFIGDHHRDFLEESEDGRTGLHGDDESAFRELFDFYPQLLCENVASVDGHSEGEQQEDSEDNRPTMSNMRHCRSNSAISAEYSSKAFARTLTKHEFETLPPIIQRKYFSALERIRFAQNASYPHYLDLSSSTDPGHHRPRRRLVSPRSDRKTRRVPELDRIQPQTQINSADRRFYASLPDKIKRLHLTEAEQLAAQQRPQSIALALDQSTTKFGRRRSETSILDSRPDSADSSDPEDTRFWELINMALSHDAVTMQKDSTEYAELYDSFRWVDEDDDLNLRLALDDYHSNLRNDVPPSARGRLPSFRRRMSISKLPFSRSSATLNRPGTNEAATTPRSPASFSNNAPLTSNHLRRKSRALSLMSPNKHSQDSSVNFDAAAAHYRDPEARMKLREYLATPQKFDEAIEFGFPSMEENSTTEENKSTRTASRSEDVDGLDMMGTFLDEANSIYSGEATATEPDSPKTPDPLEFSLPSITIGPDTFAIGKPNATQAPTASREMTLRMTLTRPDLRAHEDDIYGWKVGALSRVHIREASVSPTPYIGQGSNAKDNIARQFAAIDFEQAASQDANPVKRFWNRVRRA